MAQDTNRGEYVLIQLEENVDSKKWIKNTVTHSDFQEWGVKMIINHKLDPIGIGKNSCSSYFGCKYYHALIKFELFIGSTENSEHALVRLCYIPASWSTRNKSTLFHDYTKDKHTHNSDCQSFIWALNYCFVKIHFLDENNPGKFITKRFQIEPKIGVCGSSDHCGVSTEEFSFYKDNEFIRKSILEREIGYKMEPDIKFPSVNVEINAQVYLVGLQNGIKSTDYEKHRQIPGQLQLCKSANLITPVANPFSGDFRSRKAKKTFFKEPDIAFQIGSKPDSVHLAAHSCILESQSPVFSAMFSADMAEKKSGLIKLKDDVDKNTLQVFLKMVYEQTGWVYQTNDEEENAGSEVHSKMNVILKVLQLAHMYQAPHIIDFCLDNLISCPDSELTFELAVEMSKAGKLYNEIDLGLRTAQWFKSQMRTNRSSELRKQAIMLLKRDPSDANIEFVGQAL